MHPSNLIRVMPAQGTEQLFFSARRACGAKESGQTTSASSPPGPMQLRRWRRRRSRWCWSRVAS